MINPPSSLEQYTRHFNFNAETTGHGMAVTQHIPCAWCAARHFMTVRILYAAVDLAKAVTCSECGRSGTNLIQTGPDGQITQVEFVQTGGDPPPDWMPNPPRFYAVDQGE